MTNSYQKLTRFNCNNQKNKNIRMIYVKTIFTHKSHTNQNRIKFDAPYLGLFCLIVENNFS